MRPEEIEPLFTRKEGQFQFARWGRPVCPVVFGVEDSTLAVVKAAVQAVTELAGHEMGEMDAELGSNLMFFFFSEWEELLDVPGMDGLLPELQDLVARLRGAQANQYRLFRFDESGAIKACFVFLRMDAQLSALPAQNLALSQVVQCYLLWGEAAFAQSSPLMVSGEAVGLRPDIAAVLRAGYDPVLPAAAADVSHAYRLAARIAVQEAQG
ncbi:MAG: hypothetical protein ACSHWZ_03590 [Sulfitobacter sp.]